MKKNIMSFIIFILFLGGCASKNEVITEKKILSPESVEIYDISVDKFWKDINNGRKLLKNFPFVSYKPIVDFKGKFSNQFYSKIDYRYKFDNIKDVDFWKLRTNPFAEDFIYVLPMWVNEFKRVSNDLFEDIGYTYNLSTKEQEILKWWIGEGGILWIEGGIYSTRYDTFKKNGEIDKVAINNKIRQKSSHLKFFDRPIHTYVYKSKRVDSINYEPLKLDYKTKSKYRYFSDIKNLQIKTDNFLTADFLPKGDYLLKSLKGKPLVSFIRYGKGGVVFLRPFEFQDKRYDGELLRWRLIFWLMNRMYIKNSGYQMVKDKFDANKVFTLHNLHFAYKSYKLTPNSIKLLKPIVNYLKHHPDTKLRVEGNTDNIASRKYNLLLSKRRANSVKQALVKMGIAPNRIYAVGYGEDKPIATNKTAKGRALNRRVDFIIIRK